MEMRMSDSVVVWDGEHDQDLILPNPDESPTVVLLNAIGCRKCKTVAVSTHRHDCQSCACEAVFVDGGHEYTRYGGDPKDYITLAVTAPNTAQSQINSLLSLSPKHVKASEERRLAHLAMIQEQIDIYERGNSKN